MKQALGELRSSTEAQEEDNQKKLGFSKSF